MFRRLIVVIVVIALTSVLSLAGAASDRAGLKAGDFPPSDPYSATLPQIVVGPDFTSELTFANKGGMDCFLTVDLHRGAGVPLSNTILTNGQPWGSSFSDVVPAGGSLRYTLTTPPTGRDTFQGAATYEVLSASCAASVTGSGNYLVSNGSGQLQENFSVLPSKRVGFGACGTAAIQYDPDSSDGRTRIPGVATVGAEPLSGVELCMDFRNSEGDYPFPTKCSSYSGTHQTSLFYETFPEVQNGIDGTWIACLQLQGNLPPPSPIPVAMDVTFIDVLQDGPALQFGNLPQSVEGLLCVPGMQTGCLHGDRFTVKTDTSSGPAEVGRITEDSVLFFLPNNTELLVVLQDACNTASNHFWVFAGGLTNVEFELTVQDTQNGSTRTYTNNPGQAFQPIFDTAAFATCP